MQLGLLTAAPQYQQLGSTTQLYLKCDSLTNVSADFALLGALHMHQGRPPFHPCPRPPRPESLRQNTPESGAASGYNDQALHLIAVAPMWNVHVFGPAGFAALRC